MGSTRPACSLLWLKIFCSFILGTLVSIIQNDYVSFSFLQLTYLGITQAVCSITSTFGFWYIQRYFKLKTKTMFMITNFFSVLIPFWGMLGLWTSRIGYHHRVCYLSQANWPILIGLSGNFTSTMSSLGCSKRRITPYVPSCSSISGKLAKNRLLQYAQTMISELMPRGYDNMFFALFGITNRAVSGEPAVKSHLY